MYYFIINPNSRSGKGALIWRDLENILRERNIKYQTFFTEYKGHAVKLSASITASIPEDSQIKLIAVGGDGTIQEVLSGVKDISRVIFGYIPTGSGNDFCRSHSYEKNSEQNRPRQTGLSLCCFETVAFPEAIFYDTAHG